MSGSTIEYIIEDKVETTDGVMSSIVQKNSKGFRIQGMTSFQFFLKLKTKAVISIIQYQPMVGQTVLFQLLGDRKVVHHSVSSEIQIRQSNIADFSQSRDRKSVTTRVRVEMTNKKSPVLGVGMMYIILKGEKIEEKKTVARMKDDYFEDAKMSVHRQPVSSRKKQLFDNRNKTRNEAKIKSEIINLQKGYDDYNNDSQMRKAIEMSQKQALKNKKKEQVGPKEEYSLSINVQPREYTKVDFEKHKNIFQHVNQTWLSAQMREEKQRGIRPEERLSSAINVRHFHNKKIFIDINPASKKQELQKMCQQMGANLVKEPCDNCLFITNRADTEKVAKAKKLKFVKILKPAFIEDCKKCEAYLNQKEYFHKL